MMIVSVRSPGLGLEMSLSISSPGLGLEMSLSKFISFLLILNLTNYHLATNPNICTDASKMRLATNAYLPGFVYQQMSGVSVIGCMKLCSLQGSCLSYNYFLSDSLCQLNGANTTTIPMVITTERVVYGESYFTPGGVLGMCKHGFCNKSTTCREFGSGSERKPVCEITDCGYPPSIKYASPSQPIINQGIHVGVVINYTCDDGYLPIGQQKCQPDGHWTFFTCYRIVQSCRDLQLGRPDYTDGEFWLHYDNSYNKVKTYCHAMDSDTPTEFVSLPHLSQTFHHLDGDVTSCKQTENINKQTRTRCGTITFHKLAFKSFRNLEVDISDWTFANATCDLFPLMSLGDCSLLAGCDVDTSQDFAYMDTHDTSFVIPSTKVWKVGKGSKNEIVRTERSQDGKNVSVFLAAGCGTYYPDGRKLHLEFDPLNEVESDEAVFPVF